MKYEASKSLYIDNKIILRRGRFKCHYFTLYIAIKNTIDGKLVQKFLYVRDVCTIDRLNGGKSYEPWRQMIQTIIKYDIIY